MPTSKYIIFFIILRIYYAVGQKVEEERMSELECREAGFNPESLKCSTCKMLDKFNLEEILTDCLKCCEEVNLDEKEVMNIFQFNIII